MNWQHFRAFLWLRWRIRVNQLKRGGIANAIVAGILAVGALILSIVLFVAFLCIGLFAIPKGHPIVILWIWDGLVVAFLFCWLVGLLTDLQRSEVLSLEKFLHLPVSLTGAFVLNYLSSMLSMTIALFLPAMLGFWLGLVFARGPLMLLVLPFLAAFFFMVTSVTHQFQGWLAALMVNKRRRRTIIVVLTIVFVLLVQMPNLFNIYRPAHGPYVEKLAELNKQMTEQLAELKKSFEEGKIDADQFKQRHEEIAQEHNDEVSQLEQQTLEQVARVSNLANTVLPPGWLPLGAADLAQGKLLPGLLGLMGMTLIGSASLWRSYRTTVRLYTGYYTASKRRTKAAAVARAPANNVSHSNGLLEREIPWFSQHAVAIALAGFRSLLRAPESKMMLLTPLILVVVFGSLFLAKRSTEPHEFLRPLMAFGGMSMMLLGTIQFIGNQFGFDRNGFRVYVLSSARRRDILLGKNLAFAPLGIGLTLVAACVVEAAYPMRLEHFLAILPQLLSMYLLVCVLGNFLSLLAPVHIPSGSLRASHPKISTIFLQLLFVWLMPMSLAPTMLPLGIEFVLQAFGTPTWIPICLILSCVECVAIVYLFRLILAWQGNLLQAREQRILEIVTTKDE